MLACPTPAVRVPAVHELPPASKVPASQLAVPQHRWQLSPSVHKPEAYAVAFAQITYLYQAGSLDALISQSS